MSGASHQASTLYQIGTDRSSHLPKRLGVFMLDQTESVLFDAPASLSAGHQMRKQLPELVRASTQSWSSVQNLMLSHWYALAFPTLKAKAHHEPFAHSQQL